jgi:hypothetical protein
MKNPNVTKRHLLTDEVDVNLDMLRTTMLYWVASHVDSADIVTKDNGGGAKWTLKFVKKLANPTTLSNGVRHSTILRLGTGPRDRGLALGRPRHKVITKVDTIARSRPASVRAACPVSVRVRGEGRSRCRVQPKTKVHGPLEVPKNPLNQVKVRLARSMHIEARLLHGMSNIRARQCKVLKGAYKAAILGRVSNQRTIIGGELATSVNGSRTRVALKHAGSLKKVEGILALRQQHTSGRASDRNPEEEGEIPEISHGELAVEQLGDVLK